MPLYFFAKSKAKGDFPEAVGPAIIIILNLSKLKSIKKINYKIIMIFKSIISNALKVCRHSGGIFGMSLFGFYAIKENQGLFSNNLFVILFAGSGYGLGAISCGIIPTFLYINRP